MAGMRWDDVLMLALAARLMEMGRVVEAAFMATAAAFCLVLPEGGER